MYLKPDEVDIKEPPTIVNRIKNRAEFPLEVQTVMPEVEIEEIIAKNIFTKLLFEFRKK